MRIKPKIPYEDMCIYYIINVNLLHVFVTFGGHLQGGITKTSEPIYKYTIPSFEYVIVNM